MEHGLVGMRKFFESKRIAFKEYINNGRGVVFYCTKSSGVFPEQISLPYKEKYVAGEHGIKLLAVSPGQYHIEDLSHCGPGRDDAEYLWGHHSGVKLKLRPWVLAAMWEELKSEALR